MTNREFIKGFLTKQITRGVCNHLMIRNGELINYSTVLAKWDDKGKLFVNTRKYSSTTSHIQGYIKDEVGRLGLNKYLNNYEEYVGQPCYYWNCGYMGAPMLRVSDL